MNKKVCKALLASTDSISLELESFVLELGHELAPDSPECSRRRKVLVIEATSNALTFVASIAMQRSIQARCRQLLRRTDMEDLIRDLVRTLLERSLVLDEIFIDRYEAFRSKVGYLRQIKVSHELDEDAGLTQWPLNDMLLLLASVEQDYTRIRLALEEISSLRRRLKFKYSKALTSGKIRNDQEKEDMVADMLVVDCHLRFLGKLSATVLSRLSFLVWQNPEASYEEIRIRRTAVSYQTAFGLLDTEIADVKRLLGESMTGLGVTEHLAVIHRLEKLFILQSVQLKQIAYLRVTIRAAVLLYKQTSSVPFCTPDQARLVDGSCRIGRYMLINLQASAAWLRRKIISVGRMMGKEDRRRVLGTVLNVQKEMLAKLERWEETVARLERVSAVLLSRS